MKYITLRMLAKHGACQAQRDVFAREFGKRAYISEKNLTRARDNYLGVIWLVHVLDFEHRRAFIRATSELFSDYMKEVDRINAVNPLNRAAHQGACDAYSDRYYAALLHELRVQP